MPEINWGILPGGGATKVATTLMPMRTAMYHALLGETMDGPTAARVGLVNESLPLAALENRVLEGAEAAGEKLGDLEGRKGCGAPRHGHDV